ncbi:MAG: DNA methyltransferase [Porticoccaceae bacterium]
MTATTDPRHPAKFSAQIMEAVAPLLPAGGRVLDPFAGTGRIHTFGKFCTTYGIEIEPEWANMHPRTRQGDALQLCQHFGLGYFDAIFTSPTYGNRMADHHNAKDGSKRHTYTHALGRDLHPNNSGKMQWGQEYRLFHEKVWRQCYSVLKHDGRMIVNVSDHVRKGQIVPVTSWHRGALLEIGFIEEQVIEIETPRLKHGANADLRTGCEYVLVFRKPGLFELGFI